MRHGLRVIPLRPTSKIPAKKSWQKKPFKSARRLKAYARKHPNANYGILTGRDLVVLDPDGAEGKRNLRLLAAANKPLPKTVTVVTPGGGRHLYFRPSDDDIKNSVGKLAAQLDVRGKHGFVVAPGSVHPTGMAYSYARGFSLAEIRIAPLPAWLYKLAQPKQPATGTEAKPLTAEERHRAEKYATRALELESRRVRSAPVHQRNNTLNLAAFRIGQILRWGVLATDHVEKALAGAAFEAGLPESEACRTVRSGLDGGGRSPRSLPGTSPIKDSPRNPNSAALTAEIATLGETDADNAIRLVRRFGDKLLYTPGLGYLVFEGGRWLQDIHNKRLKFATETARAISREAKHLSGKKQQDRYKFRRTSLSKASLDRMLALAQPDLSVDDSRLDADRMLLNVKNGTIDLTTGRLLPHDPADLITRQCAIHFNPKAKCPRFKRFLLQSASGDKAKARFIKKAIGYSLTGAVGENVLFFLYGPHGTGKSTLVNLVRDLLGEYGIHTPSNSLMVRQFDNGIPVDTARMKGARVVTAIEANAGQQFDEAKIKSWTGGDKLTGRFMRQNLFEFDPEFKLWLAANDLPRIRATDDAIWARFVIIRFAEQVKDNAKDRKLSERLRAEFEGILAWAVRGAKLWQKEGLQDKELFQYEKNAWRDQSDTVGRFFREKCHVAPLNQSILSSVLYGRYQTFCAECNEKPSSDKVFKARLIELGVSSKHTNKGTVWSGIELKI